MFTAENNDQMFAAILKLLRSEALTPLTNQIAVFWDVTRCKLAEVSYDPALFMVFVTTL
jgi:hypothetical protein